MDTEKKERPVVSSFFKFFIQGSGGLIEAAFANFSGIRMQVDTLQSRDGDDRRGVQEYIPVLTRYDPVTLSKGVVGDNGFLDWLLAASAGEAAGPTGKDLRRSVDIVTYNENRERAVIWTLLNAMPIGYELSPMDGTRSEVLMESLTLAFTGVKRIKSPPNVKD